jgi:hypothetical protein
MSAVISDAGSVPAATSLLTSGEKLLSPAARAKLIPSHRERSHVNAATVFRWTTRGVKTSGGGAVVRLEAVHIGSFWRSSLEAVARFSAALTAAALATDTPLAPLAPTPKQRHNAQKRASKEADAILGGSRARK